ncbi:hypothetical protein AgCh_034162 [Apium graveolens]
MAKADAEDDNTELKGDRRNALVLDSGCLGHMTGYESLLSKFEGKKAKQRKTSFKSKTESSILEPYHLIHVDLFGPVNVMSISKKRVVKRKNRTLIEAIRTMLEEARLPTYFWDEAVQIACFTQNATLINKHGKIPFEMVKGKKPNLKFFHIFGCKCFVLKTHPEQLTKFDLKDDEGIFVGLEDADDHDILRFENEVPYAELLSPDYDTGEQHGSKLETTTSDSTQETSLKRSSDSSSLNSDESNTDNNGNTDSGGASGNNSGTNQRNNRKFMDQGGSFSRSQLPSTRKWSKSHT